jgi:hypothetical protein
MVNHHGKGRPPNFGDFLSPDVEKLLDPEFTFADFELAMRKILGAPLTPEEHAKIQERYGGDTGHRNSGGPRKESA